MCKELVYLKILKIKNWEIWKGLEHGARSSYNSTSPSLRPDKVSIFFTRFNSFITSSIRFPSSCTFQRLCGSHPEKGNEVAAGMPTYVPYLGYILPSNYFQLYNQKVFFQKNTHGRNLRSNAQYTFL